MQKISKEQVIQSFVWKLMERMGTQIVSLVVSIILARLLLPSDYGVIAIITIFILIANVLVQSGFSQALVQDQSVGEIDFSSVLYLSLLVAAVLYGSLFVCSPFIAMFYKEPLLSPVIRVLSVILFFGAFNSVQIAYISRHMLFKRLFFSSSVSSLFSGVVGIVLAFLKFGVWALVAQQISSQAMICLVLWFTVKWRPQLVFSLKRVKKMFSFGWKLMVSGLLDTVFNNIQSLIIGRLYNPSIVGYYNNGQQFPGLIVTNVDTSIQSVMFPALSSHQDNKEMVKQMMRRVIMTSSFIMFPATLGLATIAQPLILLLLGAKWLPAVPFLQIACLYYSVWPLQTANLATINALGYSSIFLKIEVIKKVVGIAIIIGSIPFGMYGIAWGMVLTSFISTFINAFPNKRLVSYAYFEQWKDIAPSLVLSIIACLVSYSISFTSMPAFLLLFTQVLVGLGIYLLLAKVFKLEEYQYLGNEIKNRFAKKV